MNDIFFCKKHMKASFLTVYISLILLSLCIPSQGFAQTAYEKNSEKNVKKALEDYISRISENELSQAQISILATDGNGNTIISRNSNKLMLPASNLKLVTTGLALHILGGDYKYETKIGYSGRIIDGTLEGDLYIIGSGDPTLASDDSIAVRTDILFGNWKNIIESAGIKSINGYIIGDGRVFQSMPEIASWQYDDTGTYYGTGTCGLSFHENIQTFHAAAGAITGDIVHITEGYPHCPWMKYTYSCTTGKAGTGDKLYYYATDLAPKGEIRGTFAIDRTAKKLEFSNKFPAYTCAWHFSEYLTKQGIKCLKGAADTKIFSPARQSETEISATHIPALVCQDSLTIIGSTASPSLKRIAFETNHESNNLYAETLYLTIGKESSGKGDIDSSALAAQKALKAMGVETSKMRIKDGSGLSRQNYVSAEFLCSFLAAMTASPSYNDFLNSLPYPGAKGTMETVMTGYKTTAKNRIRLKSGSMTGVKCFSGYILPSEETSKPLVFSILINNCTLSQYSMQKLIDRMLFLLSESIL